MFLPALVCLSVCLSVCLIVCLLPRYLNKTWTDLDEIFGKVPRRKSKPNFVFGYDRYPGVEVTVQKRRKPGIFSSVNKPTNQ